MPPLFETDLENDILAPLPPGMYPAEITGSIVRKDKNESDMILWHWSVIEPGENMGYELTSTSGLQNNVRMANGEVNKTARKKANFYLKQFFDTIRAPY